MRNKKNLMRKKYLNNSKGFTLAELMLTVAIISILAGFGFVAVSNHETKLRKLEADNVAREIYNAAQNQLTSARANGSWEGFLLSEATRDIDTSVLGISTTALVDHHDFRYILVNSEADLNKYAALDYILPRFSIDGTVRSSGSYIIEYDVTSASIYKVWYSNKSNGGRALTESDLSLDTSKDDTGKRGNIVGSYGGLTEDAVAASVRESSPTLKPLQVEIINGENLVLRITDPNEFIYQKYNHGNVPTYKVRVTNKGKDRDTDPSGSFEISLSAESGEFTPSNTKDANYQGITGNRTDPTKDKKEIISILLLDSVTVQNGHFAQIFPTLAVGGDIDVEVSTSVTIDKEKQTVIAGDTDNSLFEKLKIDETVDESGNKSEEVTGAYLSRRRHMENLSTEIAVAEKSRRTVFDRVTNAYLDEDIDFNDLKDLKDHYSDDYPLSEIYSVKGVKYTDSTNFVGIVSNSLQNFDGQDHRLSNLHMVGEADAKVSAHAQRSGMFTSLTSTSPIMIRNLTVNGASSRSLQSEAAIMVTHIEPSTTVAIRNIQFEAAPIVSATTTAAPGDGEGNASQGTIAGCVDSNASLSIDQISYEKGLVVGAEDAATTGGYSAGGLVGRVLGGVTIGNQNAASNTVVIKGTIHVRGRDVDAKHHFYFGAGALVGAAYAPGNSSNDQQYIRIYHTAVDAVGAHVNIQSSFAGGMVGNVMFPYHEITVADTTLNADEITITDNYRSTGGFAGELSAQNISFINAGINAKEKLEITAAGTDDDDAGGFIGSLYQRATGAVSGESVSISNCWVDGGEEGIVNATARTGHGVNVGGFFGQISPSSAAATIENCYSSILVKATNGSAGGFVGDILGDWEGNRQKSKITISHCYAAGRTTNANYDLSDFNVQKTQSAGWYYEAVGGFAGNIRFPMTSVTFDSCYTTASIYSNGENYGTGGFIGNANLAGGGSPGTNDVVIHHCYTTALTASANGKNYAFIGAGEHVSGTDNHVLAGINEPAAYEDVNSGIKIAAQPVKNSGSSGSLSVDTTDIGTVPFATGTAEAKAYDPALENIKAYPYYSAAQLSNTTLAAPTKVHAGDWPVPLASNIVTVDNGENLVLAIDDPNESEWTTDGTYQYIAKVTGASSGNVYTLRLTPQSDGTVNVEIKAPGAAANVYTTAGYKGIWKAWDTGNGYQVTALLDSVTVQNAHFAQLFPKLTPGEDISVSVTPRLTIAAGIIRSGRSVTANITEEETKTTRTTVNSFFADGSTLTNALLTTRRHMENLSEEIATVPSVSEGSRNNVTSAVLEADLDFAAIKNRGWDTYGYALTPLYLYDSSKGSYNENANFIGIISRTLTTFDGNGHTLSNLNLVGEEGISNSQVKFTGYSRRAGLFTGLTASGTITIKNLTFDGTTRSTNSSTNGVEAAILLTRVDKDKHVEISNITFTTAPQVIAKTDNQDTDSDTSAWEVHANAGVITACVAHDASLKMTDIKLLAGLTVGDENDTAHNGYAAGGLVGLVVGSAEIGDKDTAGDDITIGGTVRVSGRDDDLSRQSPNRNYYGAGAVIGSAYAASGSTNQSVKMYHVAVNADSVDIRSAYAGGMIGAMHFPFAEAEIENCSLTAPNINITNNNVSAGGFAGNLSAQNLKVNGCFVEATDALQLTADGPNDHGVGGFIGEVMQRQEGDVGGTTVQIENSFVAGGSAGSVKATNTSGGMNAGGFIGIFSPSSENASIENCYASIPVSTTGGSVGAFAGDILGDGESAGGHQHLSAIAIRNCYASGRTHSGSYSMNDFNVVEGDKTNWDWSAAGGFIGVIRRPMTSLTISSCYTTASVQSSGDSSGVGGFIGAQNDGGVAPLVTNCYTTALVSGDSARTFIGAGTLADGSGKNYVLAGINDASIKTGAAADIVSVVKKGTAPFTAGNYSSAEPYDDSLHSSYDYYTVVDLCESAKINLPSDAKALEIIEKHVGDWPVSSASSTDELESWPFMGDD